ncbi:hypothetical protein AMAG_12391 [Allomyces macrogynus ATCC 38327]|uniref:Zn(2)-C6 fungal-type domain-containing protein n=1 Tax=Allomyces macrogynus (strain ATCC 38327) TaxID=578462 RepID=A0A0L0SYS6_ALLM3|nr:hypothetical protein AMAG_12391 [Allomyces macrogynus ATCC 38327]|eukprot:KNE67656.1 hypothetical protein AMAG_12391 [Allomyces macrogynus ATCC 38327]
MEPTMSDLVGDLSETPAAAAAAAATAAAAAAAQHTPPRTGPVFAGPMYRRTRTTQACETCRKRKVKCDGHQPCRHCFEFSLECRYVATPHANAKRPRKSASAAAPQAAAGETPSPEDSNGDLTASAAGGDTGARPASSRKRTRGGARASPAGAAATASAAADAADAPASGADSSGATDVVPRMSAHPSRSGTPETAGASSMAMTAATAPPPPPPPRFTPRGPLASPGSRGASAPARTIRESTAQDIEDMTENMLLMVSLDASGRPRSYSKLGHSNGLHLLRGWSQAVNTDSVLYVHPQLQNRLRARELAREQALFPQRHFVLTMFDVYFATMHHWIPILDRTAVLEELDKPMPHFMLLYAVLCVGCAVFERLHQLTVVNSPRLWSTWCAERVLRMLPSVTVSPVHQIETVQAILLVGNHYMNAPGSPWVLNGIALRIAQDMGLHTDLRAPPFRTVNMCIPTWGKTWCFTYTMDRFGSALSGRPLMFHEDDCFLSTEVFLKTPENMVNFREDLLIEPDHFFVWYVRLMDITGKIIRSINSIWLRRNLPYTLPELHAMLSQYRAELPKALQFDPNEKDRRKRTINAALSLVYYSSVVSLYRPLVSSRSAAVASSPMRPQYLALLEASVKAMLQALETIVDDMALFPYRLHYVSITLLSVCVLIADHSRKLGRPADPAVVSYLDRIDTVLAKVSPTWPASTLFRRIVHDVKANIQGVRIELGQLGVQTLWVMEKSNTHIEDAVLFLDQSPDVQRPDIDALAQEYVTRFQLAGLKMPCGAGGPNEESNGNAQEPGARNGSVPSRSASMSSGSTGPTSPTCSSFRADAAAAAASGAAYCPRPNEAMCGPGATPPTGTLPNPCGPNPCGSNPCAPDPAAAAAFQFDPASAAALGLPTFPASLAARDLGQVLEWSPQDALWDWNAWAMAAGQADAGEAGGGGIPAMFGDPGAFAAPPAAAASWGAVWPPAPPAVPSAPVTAGGDPMAWLSMAGLGLLGSTPGTPPPPPSGAGLPSLFPADFQLIGPGNAGASAGVDGVSGTPARTLSPGPM